MNESLTTPTRRASIARAHRHTRTPKIFSPDSRTEWLAAGNVQKLVVVIAGQDSGETLERWVFDVQTDKSIGPDQAVEKPQKEITSEIQAIIRQITASVTFLPLLEEPCTFDLLVYTDADVDVPKAWEESDPKYIASSDEVKLRSFTTKVHKVDTMVSYKADM